MRVKRGRHERISRHAPFGWDFGADGSLVVNLTEQDAIAWMRRQQAQGASLRGIADQLNGRGISAQAGQEMAAQQRAEDSGADGVKVEL